MELLAGILVTVGVVLGLLLIIFVYTVRKYLLLRTTQFTLLTGENETDDFKKFKGGSNSGFEIPVYTRPIRRQIPPSFGLREGPIHEKRKKSSVTMLDTQSLPPHSVTGGGSGPRKKTSRASHSSIGEKENRLVESTLAADIHCSHGDYDVFTEPHPKFDKTQRRISSAVINVLALQGKQAPPSSRVSITEDMFIRDLEINNDAFLNVDINSMDEGSSVHSLPEVVDSPSIGTGVKRRVVDRRQCGADNAPLKRTYKKSGKIKFTTRYFHEDNMLELHIHKAYDLKLKKEQRDPTCFVRVYLVPGKRQKKETQSARGLEPFFNEKIQFIDLEEQNLIKYRIKMKVYNKERMKKKELLGEVGIALNSIDINAKETFTPDLFLQRSESSLASVSILLCHQVTYNKLEVTVQKACNLPRIGMGGHPSTYATVQLFKENSVDKKDIVVKKNSRDPVFKEMVEFDVDIDAGRPLSRYSLVISLIHKAGIVGRDEILGHVIFSISSPQKSAAEHWKFICDTPHQHLEQTHSLVDPDELLCSNESSSN